MIFSMKVYVTLLEYLKIPQVAILGDLVLFKMFLFHLPDVCSATLPDKLYALTHPPSLSANRGRL
jgi:hypothetical protein